MTFFHSAEDCESCKNHASCENITKCAKISRGTAVNCLLQICTKLAEIILAEIVLLGLINGSDAYKDWDNHEFAKTVTQLFSQ